MTSLTVVQGIDVSNWQGAMDWPAWRGKIGFAMAKATEGDAITDPEFARNWADMRQADPQLCRFAYSFFHPSLDPVVQAAHLVATVKGRGLEPGDNFVLDLEETDGLPPPVVAARAGECLQHVNELAPGHRVLVYSFPAFAAAGNCKGLEAWHLWLADYGVPAPTAPAPWGRCDFWQYTDQPVDGDRFMGTEAELLTFCRMPGLAMMPGEMYDPEMIRVLREINARLHRIEQNQEKIIMSQSDIDAATAQIETEVADLGTQDAAILAAQNAFAAEIATLKGQGVNTTALVAATAQLLAAQGANDSTVAALAAASAPPAPAAPPAALQAPAAS